MKRIWFAAAAAVALCGLAATPARAATTHPAAPANVGPYQFIWAPSGPSGGEGWEVATSGVFYNSTGTNGGVGQFLIGGNGNGYQELILTGPAGNLGCEGWNNSHADAELQPCSGASWQLWAGTGGTPDLIWNKWYDTTFHTNCPVPGGYTQSVISAFFAGYPAGDLGLYCPQNSATQYATDQKWYVVTGS